jgi:hypothetical protein
MSFLRYGRSIVRWYLRPGAGKFSAPLPASHRLDESQLAIPRRVALLQSPPLLHQPVSSSRDPAGPVNQDRSNGGRIFDRNYAEISAGVDTMSVLAICTKPLARQGMPLWRLDRVLNTRGGVHDTSASAHAGRSPASTHFRKTFYYISEQIVRARIEKVVENLSATVRNW